MPVSISTRANKYLSGSQHYKSLEQTAGDWFDRISPSATEVLIGVYQNIFGQLQNSIVITTMGIHLISSSSIDFIAYDEIKAITAISHDKKTVLDNPDMRKLLLTLRSGRIIELPVIGSKGRGLDMTSFHSFLLGAIQSSEIAPHNPH